MPNTRAVSYFLATSRDPVEKLGALWHQPLPMAPGPSTAPQPSENRAPIRYGDYFDSVHRFLLGDDARVLKSALKRRLGDAAAGDRLRRINVYLVKHGQWYHPSRIELDLDGQRLNFVLNVAVSEIGSRRLAEEVRCLNRLGAHPAAEYIPAVYGQGKVKTPAGTVLPMWLGHWFDDYHEFHWTDAGAGNAPALGIWDPRAGNRPVNADRVGPIYRQASAILTHFFDLTTFEHIHPWHHAAGDFVVRQQNDQLDVRLITVRGYPGMIDPGPRKTVPGADVSLTLQGMLLFLLKLSLRMRLDRLDGVGELVWADAGVVEHVVAGFRSAMAKKKSPSHLPDTPIHCFDAFMDGSAESDLQELLEAVIAAYPEHHPEKSLLQREFQAHAAVLFRRIAESRGDTA